MSTRRDKEKPPELHERLDRASSLAKKVGEALRSGSRPSIDLAKDGEQLLDILHDLSGDPELPSIVGDERAAVNAAMDDWGEHLKQFCADKALLLAGAFPDFIIGGIVYVKVDPSSFSLSINDKRIKALPSGLALKEIESAVAEMARVSSSGANIISLIWNAYSSVIKDKGAAGQLSIKRASVFELLPKIALSKQQKAFFRNPVREKYTSYSVHNLRADLFTLMQQDHPLEYLGNRLVLEPTSVAEQGLFMFVPTLQRCAYIGHLTFVGVEQ